MPESIFNKTNPFLASVKERYTLCSAESQKNTFHVVLDLKGSNITYQVGDSVGIFPVNNPDLVTRTLFALKADGSEKISDRHGVEHKLVDFLTQKANLKDISKKFLREVINRHTDIPKKEILENLLVEGNKNQLNDYIEKHEIWDMLLENEEAAFSIQEVCLLMMPLLPRLYSISSSQLSVGEEVHLTVSMLKYVTNNYTREGVCSHFLWDMVQLNEKCVPVYVQPHHGFTLPENEHIPIIMIGPGTGVAPYRAFMQERSTKKSPGKSWLFFGERTKKGEFFYEDFWCELQHQGNFQLNTAFSRDQKNKIYVQDLMLEKGEEIWQWIEDGAIIYVCGDAHHMAKDVDAVLQEIIKLHSQKNEEEVKHFMKELRSAKRYLRDIY